MTLPRLTKQQAIEQLTTELKAKVAADFRAKEMRYDYKTIISHYINRIGDEMITTEKDRLKAGYPPSAPKKPTLTQAMQYLYDHEINSQIQCLWDGGWEVYLGDSFNGFKEIKNFENGELEKAALWLLEAAVKYYPSCQWKAVIWAC